MLYMQKVHEFDFDNFSRSKVTIQNVKMQNFDKNPLLIFFIFEPNMVHSVLNMCTKFQLGIAKTVEMVGVDLKPPRYTAIG
jgi:hypothetical protein